VEKSKPDTEMLYSHIGTKPIFQASSILGKEVSCWLTLRNSEQDAGTLDAFPPVVHGHQDDWV